MHRTLGVLHKFRGSSTVQLARVLTGASDRISRHAENRRDESEGRKPVRNTERPRFRGGGGSSNGFRRDRPPPRFSERMAGQNNANENAGKISRAEGRMKDDKTVMEGNISSETASGDNNQSASNEMDKEPLCPQTNTHMHAVQSEQVEGQNKPDEDKDALPNRVTSRDPHIARQLSNYKLDPEELSKFNRIARNFDQEWTKGPLRSHNSGMMIHVAPVYENNALKDIHKMSFQANVLLEVRDVRVPASSHHPSFTRLAKHRRHLICYTHADMIDQNTKDEVEAWTVKNWVGSKCMFVDVRETRSDPDPYRPLRNWIISEVDAAGGGNCALTVGVPNTGKSSMLLAIMRENETVKVRVGTSRRLKKSKPQIEDRPGKTRELTQYLLRESPRLYCLDVPGITPLRPYFEERPEAWYALCAANLLQIPPVFDTRKTKDAIAEYVLFSLNKNRNYSYVKKLKLDGPTDDIKDVLSKLKKGSETFLKFFNTGNFGTCILDDIKSNRGRFEFFKFTDEKLNKDKRNFDCPPDEYIDFADNEIKKKRVFDDEILEYNYSADSDEEYR